MLQRRVQQMQNLSHGWICLELGTFEEFATAVLPRVCCKLWPPAPRYVYHHVITFFESREWNQRWVKRPEKNKSHFKGRLGSIVLLKVGPALNEKRPHYILYRSSRSYIICICLESLAFSLSFLKPFDKLRLWTWIGQPAQTLYAINTWQYAVSDCVTILAVY